MTNNITEQVQDNFEKIPTTQEVFTLLGVISQVIDSINNDHTNEVFNNVFKGFLTTFSIPRELLIRYSHLDGQEMLSCALKDYPDYAKNFIPAVYPKEIAEFLIPGVDLINTNIFDVIDPTIATFFGDLVKRFRGNQDIFFVDEPDLVFLQSMSDEYGELSTEIQNLVNIYNDKRALRWTLMNPEVYWISSSPEKLNNCAMVILEELLHLTQLVPGKVTIHTLGYTFENTGSYDKVLMTLLGRMMESDVTSILTTAFPLMIEQQWQWYTDRLNEPSYDKHNPLRIDYLWLYGWIIADLTNQKPQYLVASMNKLPDYLEKDPQNIKDFFKTRELLGLLVPYSELLFTFQPDDDEVNIEINKLRVRAMNRGIFDIFLTYCINLRRHYGDEWASVLSVDSDYGELILQNILEYYKNNLSEYRALLKSYKGSMHIWEGRFWMNKNLTAENIFEVLVQNFQH